MERVVIERLEDGRANIFFKGRQWRRSMERGEEGHLFPYWQYVSQDSNEGSSVFPKLRRLLEKVYQSRDSEDGELQRFPRRGVDEEYAGLFGIPTIGKIKSPEERWLVDGLIPQGTINLLTAPPGGYKTWLSLWLAGCVSTGSPFLGRQTTQTIVLYLDNENPPSVISERRKILHLDSDSFHIWGHWWKHRPTMIDDHRLLDLAERHSLLIIFDPFVRFHTADENSARQMAQVFKRLRRFADYGSTILLSHHQAKAQGSQYRGSTDILAGVDAAFELAHAKGEEETFLTLNCFKHRRTPEMTIPICLDLEKGRFDVVDDPSTAVSTKTIEKIKSVIEQNPGITQKDLMSKAELPETNGRKILQRGDGQHWRSKRGKGTTLHYYPID